MVVKKCAIKKCCSSSIRKEDVGVTYHKFPKDSSLRNVWVNATNITITDIPLATFVCSRHFRRADFQVIKDSKYFLRPDAVPSIFPWTLEVKVSKMDDNVTKEAQILVDNVSGSNEELENGSLDAIKKYIEVQEKEILELKNSIVKPTPDTKINVSNDDSMPENVIIADITKKLDDNVMETIHIDRASEKLDCIETKAVVDLDHKDAELSEQMIPTTLVSNSQNFIQTPSNTTPETLSNTDEPNETKQEESMMVASSVMNMIVDQSQENLKKKSLNKPTVKPGAKGANGVALSIGSKVEAKDFAEYWHPAKIVELDYDEMEVLVHYDDPTKSRHDEWISVCSPRLRPHGSSPVVLPKSTPDTILPTVSEGATLATHIKEESRTEDKVKLTFAIGERCLARWRDNRRFMATIQTKLNNGSYEVMFDDGVRWKCGISRLSKLKDLNIDTFSQSPAASTPSPNLVSGPNDTINCTEAPSLPQIPVFHTHLFDPTRDYLGSKRERREMKRKLNIKEIFNIGQKKMKREPKVKVVKDGKRPYRRKKAIKVEPVTEVKKEIPDAIASIIGSVDKKEATENLKSDPEIKTDTNEIKIEINEIKMDINEEADATSSKFVKTETFDPEKKVKKQVEKVKCELEEMKKQFAEIKLQMKTQSISKEPTEMPESFLLPGEWCCKWLNGQPVGSVSELDANNKPGLPRRSVQVEDKRLPPGWTRHMVRRSLGNSAGKWDVVLISPENRRFHTKHEMRVFLERNPDEDLQDYEHALFDFGVHLKLARRMGWVKVTDDGETPTIVRLPASLIGNSSPLVKRKSLSLKRPAKTDSTKRSRKKLKFANRTKPVGFMSVKKKFKKFAARTQSQPVTEEALSSITGEQLQDTLNETVMNLPVLEDGYVYVGSLKVQVIDNLLRCPAEGCFKNFRNNPLIQMHIKHYHTELIPMLGDAPKVLDMVYARRPELLETEQKPNRPKILKPRLHSKMDGKEIKQSRLEHNQSEFPEELTIVAPSTPEPEMSIASLQDSPKLRQALASQKPVKRPKVLLPVRRPEPETDEFEINDSTNDMEHEFATESQDELVEALDFETAISTHTVTKPIDFKKGKKKKTFASISKRPASDDEEWYGINSDMDTASIPRSGSPDSKSIDNRLQSSESNEEQKDPNTYIYNENGERIKIVHMKREEIINCHCGFREEDGLMVQCELCLCWQHALCHNIQKESEVPEKYTCSICLNPRRGRRSQRFLHDQDRLYEGLLPGARPCHALRRSHELSGNLLRIQDALHALRVKTHVATKKDHPKLYLWAKDWENGEINMLQDKLNSDYSDLSVMLSDIGKENLPVKHNDVHDLPLDIRTPLSEDCDTDRFGHREPAGAVTLLGGLLAAGGALELPLSCDLERLKSVQEQESVRFSGAPQPEAAIENSACRARLLRHIQRCHALVDARLHSVEAQVAELESQDPSFEDDETADYFPRTKQTIQMLLRDLDTMEELGVIT